MQLSIPIFTGGEISSIVREQTSRLQQARYELENAKREAVQATQRYFSGVTSGLAQIAALQAAERSSQASLDANRTGYEVGVEIGNDAVTISTRPGPGEERRLPVDIPTVTLPTPPPTPREDGGAEEEPNRL